MGNPIPRRPLWTDDLLAKRVRSMKLRETDERDVDRSFAATSLPTGSAVRR